METLDKDVVREISRWGILYWVSGRKFCEFYPKSKKKFFALGYKEGTEDDWKMVWQNVSDLTQWQNIFLTKIKNALNLMKNR